MPIIPIIIAAAATAGAAATAATATVVAVTLTDVVVAGVTTAVVVKAKQCYDESIKDEGYREGARATAAEYELKMQKIMVKLAEASAKMQDTNEFFKLLVALAAIGMATAFADGKVDQEELKNLDELIGGLAHTKLPAQVQASIIHLKNNPPSFNTAMDYVLKLGKFDRELFEYVIEVIAWSDGDFCQNERAMLEAFRRTAA